MASSPRIAAAGDRMALSLPLVDGDNKPAKFEMHATCVNDALNNSSLVDATSVFKDASLAVMAHRRAVTHGKRDDFGGRIEVPQ